MKSQNFTIATRLEYNDELMSYLSSYITEYSKIYREMWHIMTSKNYHTRYPKESMFVTEMCGRYHLLKRTVNSIRYDIKGRIKALKALKKTELRQLGIKISQKEIKVKDMMSSINKLKPKVRDNKATEKQLSKYRNLKQSLYYQKNRLNRLRQSYSNLKYKIDNEILSLGFGGKKTFLRQYKLKENGYKSHIKWRNDYIKARDKNIFYLGSGDESCGNQMFQLSYVDDTDDFSIKLRKEYKYCNGKTEKDKYIAIEHVSFKYLRAELIKVLKEGKQPLSFRIHRKRSSWYLQCIFDIRFDEEAYSTYSSYGVLGLDYNDGFIEMSETDESGNLIGQYHYELKYHGTGKKAENEIRQTVSEIVKTAKSKGKDIVIENLDFKDSKSKTAKAKGRKGKRYNQMIHLFDYGRYKESMKNCCHRQRVVLHLVNPKDTSRIGKEKYSYIKKLNVHQAASYVIARRGQGFKDKLKA